jgi:uncharacterized membrane protein
MHPDEFHQRIDHRRLTAALADAERETGAKLYVYVSHRHDIQEAMEPAQRRFGRIHAAHNHHIPAALIYLAPVTHKFAVLGNAPVHNRCGDPLWQRLVASLERDLKAGDITAALLNAVASLKSALTGN